VVLAGSDGYDIAQSPPHVRFASRIVSPADDRPIGEQYQAVLSDAAIAMAFDTWMVRWSGNVCAP